MNARWPDLVGQEAAFLLLPTARHPIRILNRSATGFLVECHNLDFQEGQQLQLASESGTCEVWIKDVKQVVSEGRVQAQLGLEFLPEVAEVDRSPASFLHLFMPAQNAEHYGGASRMIIACALIASIFCSVWLLTNHKDSRRVQSSWSVKKLVDSLRLTAHPSSQPTSNASKLNTGGGDRLRISKWLADHWQHGDRERITEQLALSLVQAQQLELLLLRYSVNQAEVEQQLPEILTAAQMELLATQAPPTAAPSPVP